MRFQRARLTNASRRSARSVNAPTASATTHKHLSQTAPYSVLLWPGKGGLARTAPAPPLAKCLSDDRTTFGRQRMIGSVDQKEMKQRLNC